MKQKYMIIWDLNFRINEVYDARYKLYKNEKKIWNLRIEFYRN